MKGSEVVYGNPNGSRMRNSVGKPHDVQLDNFYQNGNPSNKSDR